VTRWGLCAKPWPPAPPTPNPQYLPLVAVTPPAAGGTTKTTTPEEHE